VNNGTSVALVLAVLMGGALLYRTTDGLRAFSTEGARRLSVERQPRELPEAPMEDQRGEDIGFSSFRGRWVVVEFIYTRCPTLCTTLGQSFQQIVRDLPAGRLGKDVFLLSVSFDHGHDDRPALQDYAERFQADGQAWRIARVRDSQDLARLLQTFGIVVVANPIGGFEHNAALHLVDPDGRLARIYGYAAAGAVVADLGALQ
jgi:protein SCO1